ncbi:uncharacterized protein SOCE26_047810 [Sorangium cellulosum]|uniref:Uncharacterized protein n=1 Tax=Sorangium cellulosum TaxID=56 RepID=A0A2L0EVK6_SORCE|nr:formate/nitrite transporter family protein [Sorangium cellulosum]AUX43333.1 uncharacterized protein SOCE26_047810 [Sorangium cellulosum]
MAVPLQSSGAEDSLAPQTGLPIAGALIFPIGSVIIVLLGLELVTGNFALLPVVLLEKCRSAAQVLRNFAAVFAANLAGSLFYGVLLALSITMMGAQAPDAVASEMMAIAEAKTHWIPPYQLLGEPSDISPKSRMARGSPRPRRYRVRRAAGAARAPPRRQPCAVIHSRLDGYTKHLIPGRRHAVLC